MRLLLFVMGATRDRIARLLKLSKKTDGKYMKEFLKQTASEPTRAVCFWFHALFKSVLEQVE